MKNYMCKKCETLLQSATVPHVFNCPSGGSHQWTDLGSVGNNNYQCKKCAVLVKSSGVPHVFNCPNGGSHQWTKL